MAQAIGNVIKFNYYSLQFIIMSQQFKDLPESGNNPVYEKSEKMPYVHLVYTPNKLKDSLLYSEAVTMKKDEEKNSRLREIRAENDLLQDRLGQLKRQKDGIEESLNQQIAMYKKFLTEMEAKYELKIKELQSQFSEQMQKIIRDEEDRAKIVQAQKQNYEQEIQLLRKKNQILENKLSNALKHVESLTSERQLLHTSQKQINLEMEEIKQLKKRQQIKKREEYERLKNQMFKREENYKMELRNAMNEKDKQIEGVKRQSLQDLSQLQEKVASQNEMKNSQIQQITKTFNSQFERLNSQLAQREKTIEELKKQVSEEKEAKLQAMRAYDKEINNLIFEKGRLASELDAAKCANARLMDRQRALSVHPLGLNIQIDKLRQLLLESSTQLEKCKQELVFMDRERNRLLLELDRTERQNSYLQRSRRESAYRI